MAASATAHDFRPPKDVDLSVQLSVRRADEMTWGGRAIAKRGDVVEYMIRVGNLGPGVAQDLAIGFNAAPGQRFLKDTLRLRNGALGDIRVFSAEGGLRLLKGGIDIGSYGRSAVAYAYWKMVILRRSPGHLTSVGVARVPDVTKEIYNVATVEVLPT
jgi:hypothetical protein